MNKLLPRIKVLLLVVTLLPVCANAATTYYVDADASNAGSGTVSQPFRTLQQAADKVSPGDTVIVRDGVYVNTTSRSYLIELYRGGSPTGGWVTFRAENKGKAILDGQLNRSKKAWFINSGISHIRIEGFEVREFSEAAFEIYSNTTELRNNLIHNIGRRSCSNSSYGIVGLFSQDTSGLVVDKNNFHDIGRLADGENGCVPTTTYYRNLDHGIYLAHVSDMHITNNLFYNHKRGWAIHLYSSTGGVCSNLRILHNTFAFPNPYRQGHIAIASGGLTNALIQNNIFYRPNMNGVQLSESTPLPLISNVVVSHNLVYEGVTKNRADPGVSGSNNLENSDPKVIDASAFDFHLSLGSSAIDSGLALSEVRSDIEDEDRPLGAASDRGAYEFNPAIGKPNPPANLSVAP